MVKMRIAIVGLVLMLVTYVSANLLNLASEDDLQFKLNWPGDFSLFNNVRIWYKYLLFRLFIIFGTFFKELKNNFEIFDMTTKNLEKYKCAIPAVMPDLESSSNLEVKIQIIHGNLFFSISSFF